MAALLNMFNSRFIISIFIVTFYYIGSNLVASASNEITDSEISFTPLRYSEWIEKLSTYTPNIVVVDMWATWCSSCLEEFPKIVELNRRYKDRNVQFVSMNLDDHTDQPSLDDALKFLQKMNASFDNFWMDENLMLAFKQLDLIGIPAVIIYDRDGKERYRLTGDNPNNQYTEKDIINALEKLLAH